MTGLPREGAHPAGPVARSLRRRPGRPKGALLYVFTVPLLVAALWALASGRAGPVLANAAAFVLFLGAAQLTRRGTGEQGEGRALALGRLLPAIPLRSIGGALTAVATAFAAHFSVGHGAAVSLLFGAAAAAGFHLWYGFAPLRRPAPPQAPPSPEMERANAALKEAEGRIRDIEQASLAIGNPELKARLWRIALKARQILGHIGERPDAWRRARRFLTTYLEGTQQVTRGYVSTHTLAADRAGELEQNFRNVLVTIEEVFAEQEKRLLETDLMDLDVQIEVLRKQLEQEGIV